MIKNLGKYLTFYFDTETGNLVIENHEYQIHITPDKVEEIVPVKWNKKAGEKFADVAKKKTGRKLIFENGEPIDKESIS